MAGESKSFHHRENTFIKLSNNHIFIINKYTLDKDMFAIKVCNNFYIELGRPLQDFKDVLLEADIPIVFEKITSIYGYTHYNIVRMETDDVDDLILGTVICKDGIIGKITCDSRYKTRDDFNKYDSAGVLWRGGYFEYKTKSSDNKDEAKRITLELMSLNVSTVKNELNDNFLFSPLSMANNESLEQTRLQIRKDNIETEFESGNLDEAYELVEEELLEEIECDIDQEMEEKLNTFETEDDIEFAFIDTDDYTDNVDKYINNQLDENDDNVDIDVLGNIEVSTTYSTIKIEVNLKNTEDNREYKFTFILNEISRMYELISITLV